MSRTRRGTTRTASRAEHLICPVCESGQLGSPQGPTPLVGCNSCGCAFDEVILSILKGIVALPGALGKHACECAHPELRRLPDETFHCPACGLEVIYRVGPSFESE